MFYFSPFMRPWFRCVLLSNMGKDKIRLKLIIETTKNKLAWRKIENVLIILHIPKNEIYELNRTGAYIWNKINGKKNLKEIIAEIKKEFNINYMEDLEKDIIKFIDKLYEWGLVKIKE